jgi:hypothetical protein
MAYNYRSLIKELARGRRREISSGQMTGVQEGESRQAAGVQTDESRQEAGVQPDENQRITL